MGSVSCPRKESVALHICVVSSPPPPVLPSPAVQPLFPKARAVKLVKLALVMREKAGGSPFLLHRPLAD